MYSKSRLPWKKMGASSSHNFLIALLVLIIVSLGLVVLVDRYKPKQELQPAIVANYDTKEILVARETLKPGVKIQTNNFHSVNFPRHLIIGEVLVGFPSEDTYTLTAIPAGLPIDLKNLSVDPSQAINPVLSKIPKGMRAMAVRVDATSAVEGWAGTGSIVDVILVEKDRTTLIAENVRILSAERSTLPVESADLPTVPNTVTILVTQDQCLAINTAIPRGKISLVLKSSSDQTAWPKRQMQAAQLLPEDLNPTNLVTGVIKAEGVSYALVDGQWVKSKTMPQGFFINESEEVDAQ